MFFNWGMLKVRRCKTIQFNEQTLEIPVAKCCNRALCAVYWTQRHFNEIPAGADDLAFRMPSLEGSSPIPYSTYQAMLRLFADKAGIGECDFTSHSLRRGITFLAICGTSIKEIKVRGDWASEVVYAYLKSPLQVRIMNDLSLLLPGPGTARVVFGWSLP